MVLVYGYQDNGAGSITFQLYDPNKPNKATTMHYQTEWLTVTDYPNAKFHIFNESNIDQDALEFVFEYFDNPPFVTDIAPVGTIGSSDPSRGTALISQEGTQCGDEDDSGSSFPYSVSVSYLTITVTDPDMEPPTALFMFQRTGKQSLKSPSPEEGMVFSERSLQLR